MRPFRDCLSVKSSKCRRFRYGLNLSCLHHAKELPFPRAAVAFDRVQGAAPKIQLDYVCHLGMPASKRNRYDTYTRRCLPNTESQVVVAGVLAGL